MKKWMTILLVTGAIAVFLCIGCAEQEETDTVDLSDEKSELEQDLQKSLEKVNARLSEIEQEMADASEETRQELSEEKSTLEELKTNINDKLEQLGDQTEETWEEFKRGADEVMVSIEAEIDGGQTSGGSGY